MKRLLRILVRLAMAPIIFVYAPVSFMVISFFVFFEWLFEFKDDFYSYQDFLGDIAKEYKAFWKGFFK